MHAHPCEDSFSAAIADAVVAGARDGGHELRRVSLYKEKYQPSMTAIERRLFLEKEKGHAPEVEGALQNLAWADSVVFVYPTWWFNMPGILKGWFDRTLCVGGAFDFPTPGGPPAAVNGLVPLLTNVKRVAGISTYGAPQHLAFLAGDNGRNTISTAVRPVFDPACTCLWLGLYGMDDSTKQAREAFLARVRKVIAEDF